MRRRTTATSSPRGQRLDWAGLRHYWETHAQHDGVLDLEADPDALGNVVWPGQPLWLNAHMAALQEHAYASLLARVPADAGQRALDVGCGSARWSRVLAARGFDVTGIDLQEALVELNRTRFPNMQFKRVALQDFAADEPFHLVSSVTVLQHNPAEHHALLARRIRELLVAGGHALILENVHDQASHVFARSVAGWVAVFGDARFELVARQPYDFSPVLRAVLWARRLDPHARRRQRQGTDRGPGAVDLTPRAAALKDVALRGAVGLDRPCEAVLTRLAVRVGSVHCGFLFRAR